MKIGVLGGTFDPPHVGHLELARSAIHSLGLDEVMFLPVSRNPLKPRRKGTSSRARLEMTRLLIQGEPKMSLCDIEVVRGGMSYSVETMSELSAAEPADYWFLIGADVARSLMDWKQPGRLLKICRLGVALRPPLTAGQVMARIPEDFRGRIDFIDMPASSASSSEVRDLIAARRPLGRLITEPVYAYIKEHKLYSS